MKTKIHKISDSPFLNVQKIGAGKTFLLPMLGFMMLNGGIAEDQMKKLEMNIRQTVNLALKPEDCLSNVTALPEKTEDCHIQVWLTEGQS
jgi:hypothetical protein